MLTKSIPRGKRLSCAKQGTSGEIFCAAPVTPAFQAALMVAGFDRYMQIVKCFRDEDLRADRQPEFTQIDLEMSFVNVEDVLTINEGL